MGVKGPNVNTVLTLEALAERWSVKPGELRRRLSWLGLPAVNVGTKRSPDLRFRLSAIEAWEAANESPVGGEARQAESVPAGAPPGLEDYDPYRDTKRGKGARR